MTIVADWSGLCTIHRDNVEEMQNQLRMLSCEAGVQAPGGVNTNDWIAGAQYAFGVGVDMLDILLDNAPPR